jgi:antitoxin component HigA of HigAB toxin-antitoxin module
MVDVHLIKTEADYEAALARAEKLMSAEAGTSAAEELEHLAMVIEAYEERHDPIDLPNPIAAIQFRMDQEGLSNKDQEIGGKAVASETTERRAVTHRLKCEAPFFDAVEVGRKTAELRFNDRDFRVGDVLELLRTKEGQMTHLSAKLQVLVTHIVRDTDGPWLAPGHVMLSFRTL